MSLDALVLSFFLPRTRGKSDVRQSILEYVRTFIGGFEAVRNLDVTMKKRSIEVESGEFAIYFESTDVFDISFAFDKEKTGQTINSIMNSLFDRLSKPDWKGVMSEIDFQSYGSYKIERKGEPFAKLIKNTTLEELSEENWVFAPIRLDLLARKSPNREQEVHIESGRKTVKKIGRAHV